MAISNFVIPVKVDTSQVAAGLRGVGDKFKALSDGLKSTGQALTLGVTAPLTLLGREFVKTASDAEETQAKFSAVFKELTGEAEAFVQATANELGRSTNDLRKFMGTLQDTFVPLGFARDEGLEFSQTLTTLTMDLASFNNMAESDVLAGLQSAIVGNHETLRKFGVIINQTNLNQELMNMGIAEGVKVATEAEKAQARLNLIMAGTADAQGDALRTSGSFANQTRRLQGQFEELSIELGQVIMPVIQNLIKFFGNLINRFRALDGQTKILVVALGGIAIAIGPVLTALGMLISPIGLIVAGFVGLAKVIYDNSEVIIQNLVDIANNFIGIYNESTLVRGAIQSIFFVAKTVFNALVLGVKTVADSFTGLGSIIIAALKGDFGQAKQIFDDTFSNIGENISIFGEQVSEDFSKGIEATLRDKVENVTADGLKKGLSNSLDTVKDFILQKAQELGFSIPATIDNAMNQGSIDLGGTDEDEGDEEDGPIDNLTNKLKNLETVAATVGENVGQGFADFSAGIVNSFGLAAGGVEGFFKTLMETGIKLVQMLIANAIQVKISAIKTIAAKKAEATATSIDNATKSASATGPGAIIAQPAFIATLVGGVLAAFAAIPKFAKGGIVTGPTLGLVGEAGPEAIIPLSKLGKGGTESKGEFTLRGQDLILALERAGDFRTRVSG